MPEIVLAFILSFWFFLIIILATSTISLLVKICNPVKTAVSNSFFFVQFQKHCMTMVTVFYGFHYFVTCFINDLTYLQLINCYTINAANLNTSFIRAALPPFTIKYFSVGSYFSIIFWIYLVKFIIPKLTLVFYFFLHNIFVSWTCIHINTYWFS